MKARLLYSLFTAGLVLLCLSVQMARGDVFGRISGTAKDPSGAVVPGVTVTAVCTETAIKQTSQTDAQGFYSFPSLAVGHYDIATTQPGFKDFRVTGITLDVNS